MRKSDAEIMTQDHWAVIKNVTTHHPGDERSRTNPGHGYPSHSTTEMVYRPYETEAEIMDAYQRKPSHENWKIIKASALVVKTERSLQERTATQ